MKFIYPFETNREFHPGINVNLSIESRSSHLLHMFLIGFRQKDINQVQDPVVDVRQLVELEGSCKPALYP